MRNHFNAKPTEEVAEAYVIGYLEQKIPSWITLAYLIAIWPKVLAFRELKAKLKEKPTLRKWSNVDNQSED
jgi:hypothetical protein